MIRKSVFVLSLVFLCLFNAGKSCAASGYEATVSTWRGVFSQAAQYRETLQDLYAQVEYQTGPDKSRLNSEFSKRLAQQFPGSSFYGSFGRLAVNSYTTVHFDSQWNVNNLSQRFGGLSKFYNFQDQTFEVTNGPNRVKVKLDLNRPHRSQFVIAEIPAISASAHSIWAKKGLKQGVFQPLKDILNDVYAERIATRAGTRMDVLAEQMVEDGTTRQNVLDAADELYSRQFRQVGTPSSPGRSQASATNQIPVGNQSLKTLNLFDFLPWYFWPTVIGLSALQTIASGKRRRSRGLPRVRWKSPSKRNRTGDFSMGRVDRPATIRSSTPLQVDSPVPEAFSPREEVVPQEWTSEVLSSLEWKRFEAVCAEYFRMTGYVPKETRIGADGGVDVWVYKPGCEKPFGIVQCKAWTTYKVGIKPVRELFGVMAAEGVGNGMFITSGEFTSEALTFAEGKKLRLISGRKFLGFIEKLPAEKQEELLALALEGDYRTPTCPQCGVKMALREGTGGRKEFWGCPRYPRCRATLVYKAEPARL